MIVVIPISHVDLHLAELLIERLRQISEMGGTAPHFALIVSGYTDSWDVRPLFEKIAGFIPTKFLVIRDPDEDKWPDAPNQLFIESAQWLEEQGNNEPWFFMEPDCAPLRPDWWTVLEREYAASGRRFMGVKGTARWFNLRTKEFTGETAAHMVGAGIYAASGVYQMIHKFDSRQPFDVMLGPEVLLDFHETKLIAHRWQTKNWRLGAEGLYHGELCDKAVEFGAPVAAPVDPKIAGVLHGSKDASLYQISLDAATLHGVKDLSLDTALNPS